MCGNGEFVYMDASCGDTKVSMSYQAYDRLKVSRQYVQELEAERQQNLERLKNMQAETERQIQRNTAWKLACDRLEKDCDYHKRRANVNYIALEAVRNERDELIKHYGKSQFHIGPLNHWGERALLESLQAQNKTIKAERDELSRTLLDMRKIHPYERIYEYVKAQYALQAEIEKLKNDLQESRLETACVRAKLPSMQGSPHTTSRCAVGL